MAPDQHHMLAGNRPEALRKTGESRREVDRKQAGSGPAVDRKWVVTCRDLGAIATTAGAGTSRDSSSGMIVNSESVEDGTSDDRNMHRSGTEVPDEEISSVRQIC